MLGAVEVAVVEESPVGGRSFFEPPWEYGRWATLRWSSSEHGWRSLLVHEFHNAPVADDVDLAATPDQQIVLVVSGASAIASRRAGGWATATDYPGKIGLIAPNTPTTLRWNATGAEPLRRLRVHVPGSLLEDAGRELWGDRTRPPQASGLSVADPVLVHTVLALRRAAAAGAPDTYADAAARFLAVHTLTHHAGNPPRPVPVEDRRVGWAVDYMHAHLAEPITLTDLAAAAGLSPFHFSRVFRASRGTPPMRYLTGLRLDVARRLLSAAEPPIGDIARACGFSSASYFAEVFLRRVGMSPSAYRATGGDTPRR